jgi:hypothetical protein
MLSLSAAGIFRPLAKACQALAAELQPAQQQQQQQQPASSLKRGFLSAGKSRQQPQQQQQQRRLSDSILRGLTLGKVLITLWQALVQLTAGSSYHHTLFSNADQCASVLPASQLMMVLLRAQQQHSILRNSAGSSSSGSSSSSSSSATDWSWMVRKDEPAKQVQAALSAATTLAEVIAIAAGEHKSLQRLPGVLQLLATPDLHQLLITSAAWLTGLLHQQKQGMSRVPVESVLDCLSNNSAAAAVVLPAALDDSRSSSSSNASGSSAGSSSSRVPPHHSRVLECLQLSAVDPLHSSGSARSQQPSSSLSAVNAANAAPSSVAGRLAAVLLAAKFCLQIQRSSNGHWLIGGSSEDAVTYVTPNSSSSSSSQSSGGDAGAWRQLAPAVARMLVSIVRMAPVGRVSYAAVGMLQSVVLKDARAIAESDAVVDILVELGPAVTYAVLLQQQQQQQQPESRHTPKMQHLWAMLVMNVVSAASKSDGK